MILKSSRNKHFIMSIYAVCVSVFKSCTYWDSSTLKALHERGEGCKRLTVFIQFHVPLSPGKFHVVVLVYHSKHIPWLMPDVIPFFSALKLIFSLKVNKNKNFKLQNHILRFARKTSKPSRNFEYRRKWENFTEISMWGKKSLIL